MNKLRIVKGEGNPAGDQHRDSWLALISDYLDSTISEVDRSRVQSHLAECEKCSADLEGMRQASMMLRRLPEVDAPRSFTLTPAQARRLKPAPFYRFSQVAAVAAALLLCLALTLDLSGVFAAPAAAPSQSAVLAGPTATLEAVGTLSSSGNTANGGSNRGFGAVQVTSSATAEANPAAAPVSSPANPAQTVESQAIRWIEFGLLALLLLFASFAFALRPRAPGKIRA